MYLILIRQFQNHQDTITGNVVHKILPGLRNRDQRDATLAELNQLTLRPNENRKQVIQVFESVNYIDSEYHFVLSKEVLPYCDIIQIFNRAIQTFNSNNYSQYR